MVTIEVIVTECNQSLVGSGSFLLCAVASNNSIKGPCAGDSGGGLINRMNELKGVLSAGFYCGENFELALYMEVSLYMGWIRGFLTYSSGESIGVWSCCVMFLIINSEML